MDGKTEQPSWYQHYEPIAPITADCILEWPDEKNCNEFPVICPVHGILSRCACCYTCPCEGDSSEKIGKQPSQSHSQRITSVEDALKHLWGGENIPCLLQALNSGTPADSTENRRSLFNGSHLSVRPRRPVIVNSHSLKALDNKTRRNPNVDVSKLKLGPVYAYLRDLGLFNEWCAMFKSEIRKVPSQDANYDQHYKEITVYRKYHSTGLLVNIFPMTKCFVTDIDYSHFEIRPDLHYGDQILEFGHCVLQSETDCLSRHPNGHDVFRLRVRPCPFLKWLTLSVGPCSVITDSAHHRGRRCGQRSQRDLGFSIHNGCVTAVAVNSPAAEAGLKPDQCIVEVNGNFVANIKDNEVVCLIRQAITDSCARSVVIGIIPERIRRQLQSATNLHYVSTNSGFNLEAWVNAEAFGVCYDG
ncbi:hypothetical protein FGIG_04309 [Fasciola gigantica]|uniref:PDZ domain-containing protein n=1 Tax=Fasciola gigantica TaxID=46835 RepID=A0A504Z9M9_FASGI|nr:hypothetical protein FGIG_04309 [Fasciola gigantica]